MSEYIAKCNEVVGVSGKTLIVPDYIDTSEEIVRCRDCKFGVDGGKYCAEGCADSWDWRNVEPDGFCAWAVRKDKEES